MTTGRGNTTTYSYDTLDRVTKSTYSDGHYTAYTYDQDGDQLTIADKTSGGTITQSDTFTYDKVNRTSTETMLNRATVTMTWDANSRLASFNDGFGALTYGYDSDGALTSIAEPGGSCTGYDPINNPPTTASGCTVMLVDKGGNRQVTVYPGNLARQTNTYDTSDRITEIKAAGQAGGAATTLYDYRYSYAGGTGDTDHITKRTDAVTGAYLGYTYTVEGRLHSSISYTSAGAVTSSRTWCYDANGNRIAYSTTVSYTCPGTTTSSWDGANQQLTGPDGAASLFTFDLDGQETSTATALPAAATTRTSTYTVSDQTATTKIPGHTNLASTYLGGGNNDLITVDASSTDQDELRNSPARDLPHRPHLQRHRNRPHLHRTGPHRRDLRLPHLRRRPLLPPHRQPRQYPSRRGRHRHRRRLLHLHRLGPANRHHQHLPPTVRLHRRLHHPHHRTHPPRRPLLRPHPRPLHPTRPANPPRRRQPIQPLPLRRRRPHQPHRPHRVGIWVTSVRAIAQIRTGAFPQITARQQAV